MHRENTLLLCWVMERQGVSAIHGVWVLFRHRAPSPVQAWLYLDRHSEAGRWSRIDEGQYKQGVKYHPIHPNPENRPIRRRFFVELIIIIIPHQPAVGVEHGVQEFEPGG